ncbi:MAG TPA: HD domain-containing protein [Ktedonobacterales bacterium]|nr:HD domain-containing protein [Ktedonobacterales bacterium]
MTDQIPIEAALTNDTGKEAAFVEEGLLLRTLAEYMQPDDVAHVEDAIQYAREVRMGVAVPDADAQSALAPLDVDYALSVAQTLATSLHIDTITLAAVLLYQLVEGHAITSSDVLTRLGGKFGTQVAQTISNIERFDTLQRPGVQLRRSAQRATGESDEGNRDRRRSRERQQQQDADALRKMFVAMAEDPRVVVIKIADRLRLMRAVARAAESGRRQKQAQQKNEDSASEAFTPPAWTLEECRILAEETRQIFAPLAGRLGMSRVEGELYDLAFAVLEPEDYQWLRAAVEQEEHERSGYVDRVIHILRDEMHDIGIEAEVSGRLKHLYSIYKKVQNTGSRDLSSLYDILAFRIVVHTVEECYLALGHVHELWKPKDGRIKDFIASPKPNGYQSLHTTVFCLDGRLAEIQIRTREMHQIAEYGVAMHWYYKDVGDSATSTAKPLQSWMQQVHEWQQELQVPGTAAAQRAFEAVKDSVSREQIYVFTPAGDAKELPAGSTPLDFAYRVHSDLGNHVSGVRITSDDGSGRLVKKLVPLDYELKNGDVVEVIKGKNVHPTRDWLRIVKTKTARDRIQRYLKDHERDIDMQRGHDRLDRELRNLGVRKGLEELSDDDLEWLAEALGAPDSESLLVAVGSEKLRLALVIPKLRERLNLNVPAEVPPAEPQIPASARESQVGASVEGMAGMLTRLANCCNPLPGDELRGFITRGKGVVIHRADCPNLRHLLEGQPERGVAVNWPKLESQDVFRAPIFIEGEDRPGLLRDVTGVISGRKINMLSVAVTTKNRPHRAIIRAVLEIHLPEELTAVLRELRGVQSVLLAERQEPGSGKE